MSTRDHLAWAQFLGLKNYLETVRYALLRDLVEWRYRIPRREPHPCAPGQLMSVAPQSNGCDFHFTNMNLRVWFLAPGIVQVDWSPEIPPFPYIDLDGVSAHVEVAVASRDDGYEISSNELSLRVLNDGRLIHLRPTGEMFREEHPPEKLDGGWFHSAPLQTEACVYGLGERASRLNLRGGEFRFWNQDPHGNYGPDIDPLYVSIPIYLCISDAGPYMLFYENSTDGTISLHDEASAHFGGGPLRYFLIVGSFAEIFDRYGRLTGFPSLPPRWALGYHQSRFSYETETEVLRIVEGFRERSLPLDVIHLDIDYMDGYRVFTVDKARFPDLPGLAHELREQGVRLVAILDPGIKRDPEFDVYKEGLDEGAFLRLPNGRLLIAPVWPGMVAYPDFTDPRARAWWGKYYPRMLEAGIAGFWHDMNEPVAFSAWGDPSLPRPTPHSFEGVGGNHLQAHNLYGMLMNRAGFEALRQHRPDHRPFIVSRSGWAGVQKWAWIWTGDTESTWSTLRQTIATVLGLSLSGIPFGGPDIGGFAGSPSAELYLRWFQLATLLPFFRTHSSKGSAPREPWSFGDSILRHVREAFKLRYRLMPYLYTLAWEASRSGQSLVRPLFWSDESNRDLWEIDDAFLLGEALLVAPVIEKGIIERNLRLPPGRWYDFWEGEPLEGSGLISLSAPLGRCPLLIRVGSVLPLEEQDRLVLQIYAPDGVDGGGRLYSDEGDGYGDYRVDQFTLTRSNNTLKIAWETEGSYPFPYAQLELRLFGFNSTSAEIDGELTEVARNRLRTSPFRELTFHP